MLICMLCKATHLAETASSQKFLLTPQCYILTKFSTLTGRNNYNFEIIMQSLSNKISIVGGPEMPTGLD